MTRCLSRLTIPSTAALRLSSRTLPTLPRPRPLTVARTRRLVLIGLPTSLTRILSDIVCLSHGVPRSGGGFGMIGGAAAEPVDILGAAQLGQGFERRFDEVVRIRRAQPLGQNVADAGELDDRTHAARRNHAGAFGSRAQHDAAGAETSDHFVRNRTVLNRHAHQAFLGAVDALADGLGHFVGLAQAEAHQAVVIAGDDQGAEAEAASALDDLGDAVDMHDLLFDLEALRIDALGDRAFSQCSLPAVQNFNPASRAASASALTRP